MVILAPSAFVSSWITIESAPMGRGPPVKMRTVSPGFSAWSYEPPAGAWPTRVKVVGTAGTSSVRTA